MPNTDSRNLDEITLVDLVLLLWKGKYVIIACTFLSLVAGILYVIFARPMYTTTAIFVTKTGGNSGSGTLSQLASLAGVNLQSGNAMDPSIYLADVILDQSFLSPMFTRRWYYKGDSLALEKILEVEPDTTAPNWRYAYEVAKIGAIRNDGLIALSRDERTNILTLEVNMPDPRLAYDVNRYTLDYIGYYIRNSIQTQAKEKRVFVEQRISENKRELEKDEVALADFRQRNIVTQSPQVALELARLTRDVTASQALYLQYQQQYELAKIEELDNQTLVQVVQNPEVPIRRSKPRTLLSLAVFALFGGFVGTCGVLGIHFWHVVSARMRKKPNLKA
jgi:uncharacterized protein involved in exopolysaccharide biosynthesis